MRLFPKIETQDPGWIVEDVPDDGTTPPGGMAGRSRRGCRQKESDLSGIAERKHNATAVYGIRADRRNPGIPLGPGQNVARAGDVGQCTVLISKQASRRGSIRGHAAKAEDQSAVFRRETGLSLRTSRRAD
jgi:hypothetical protein